MTAEPPVQKPSAKPDSNERLLAVCAHLCPLVSLGIIVPLVIWLVKREDSAFLDDQAKEALNFQLSVLIVSLISAITCIGPVIVVIAAVVYSILAAIEANKGIAYRYPYTFRMIT